MIICAIIKQPWSHAVCLSLPLTVVCDSSLVDILFTIFIFVLLAVSQSKMIVWKWLALPAWAAQCIAVKPSRRFGGNQGQTGIREGDRRCGEGDMMARLNCSVSCCSTSVLLCGTNQLVDWHEASLPPSHFCLPSDTLSSRPDWGGGCELLFPSCPPGHEQW